MPPEPQQRSVLPQPPIVVDVPGVGLTEFPAGTAQWEIEQALAPHSQRSTAADIGIGSAKGSGRAVLDLAKLAVQAHPMNVLTKPLQMLLPEQLRMGYIPPGVDTMLTGSNPTQQNAATVADILTSGAITGGIGAAGGGANATRQAAARAWQAAARRPVMESTRQAEGVLKEGLGGLTRQNAEAWGGLNPNSVNARTFFDSGVKAAEGNAMSAGKTLYGSLTSPLAKSRLAQLRYTTAPAINAGTYGAGGAVFDILAKLLGGGGEVQK